MSTEQVDNISAPIQSHTVLGTLVVPEGGGVRYDTIVPPVKPSVWAM